MSSIRMVSTTGALTALLAGVALVAGCGSTDRHAADPAGSSVAGSSVVGSSVAEAGLAGDLAGREFLSTGISGRDLAPGSTVRLSFGDDGQVRANAGCNHLGGTARWDADMLSVVDMTQTEMGCEQPLMEQDDWLSSWLTDGVRIELAGDTLTATGAGVVLSFADRRVADPDLPLQGTQWRLDGVIVGEGPSAAVSSIPPGINATLTIADGELRFFDGLNHYSLASSGVEVDGNTVHVSGDLAGTAVGCAEGSSCAVDMSMLGSDFRYEISAKRLTVTGLGATAGHGLMFVADA